MLESEEEAVVDLSIFSEYVGDDKEAMQELLEAFYETAEECLAELQSNITEGENIPWSEAAHKLKGAAGFVGAKALHRLSAEAQNMKVASLAERQTHFGAIKSQYEQVDRVLREKTA